MFLNQIDYRSAEEVQAEYPEMLVVIQVDGGWMAFETNAEFKTWESQV